MQMLYCALRGKARQVWVCGIKFIPHTCGWAVFDITNPVGQVIEIERARDYGVNVLLVRSDPKSHSPHVSDIIMSLGYQLEPYSNAQALPQAIRNFLL